MFRDVAILLEAGAAGIPIIYYRNNFYFLSNKFQSSIFKYLTFDKITQGLMHVFLKLCIILN
jgi:hypothetical protein